VTGAETPGDRFRVLHVCTGNICRSPMAEALMRDGLRRRLGERADAVEVASAGTMGFTGAPMEPFALSTLHGLAVDGSAFRARELLREHVETSDLVLAASREHRAAAVVLFPRASSRTFTLRELARLCTAVDPASLPEADGPGGVVERGRALVRAAAACRGLVPPASPRDDDLEDPYRGPEAGFRTTAALVQAALQLPLDLWAGPVRDAA
jgi:protein-tyrosine phosphatase